MALNTVSLPFGYYPDPTKGRPVFNGSIFIGVPDLDPTILANQKTVTIRQEGVDTPSVPQPISTSAGGVPVFNGSPAEILVDGSYSMAVLNNQDSQVYYVASQNDSETFSDTDQRYGPLFATVAAAIAANPVSIDGVVVDLVSGMSVFTQENSAGKRGGAPYLIKTLAEFGGTPDEAGDHTAGNGNVLELQYSPSITTDTFGGNVQAHLEWANNTAAVFHKKTVLNSDRYLAATQLLIDESTDTSSTLDHRNLIIQGEGGFGTEQATEIRGTENDINKSVARFDSVANLQLRDIGITSNELNLNTVLRIDAGDSPAFSAHVGSVSGCYFQSFAASPTNAIVKVVNGKNHAFRDNWFGVTSPSDPAIKVGGLGSANTTKLQQGEENCFSLENNFIFGRVVAERMLNFAIDRNSFIENFDSSVSFTAGGIMHCGHISGNYFTGVDGDPNNATAIDIPPDVGEVEDNACINITENRFRFRDIGVNVQSKKPVSIWNNFARVNATGLFITIQATAENVTVGPNDFSDVFATAGAIGIKDLRHTFGTDQPTANVDKDIVADFMLGSDDTSIGGTNSTQLVGSVSGVNLRGGKYRVRCNVPVRNSSSGKPLTYAWWLRYRDESNVLRYIGIGATSIAPDPATVISGTAIGLGYIERIIYLPPTTLVSPATSSFELYVRNVSAATINSGWVEGTADEFDGSQGAWFQVEEYRD
jgi:hypothetical protein